MKITNELLTLICKNARLELTESQREEYKEQLGEVVDMFNSISQVDTQGIEPMYHPVGISFNLRDDVAEDTNTPIEIETKDGYIIGPKLR